MDEDYFYYIQVANSEGEYSENNRVVIGKYDMAYGLFIELKKVNPDRKCRMVEVVERSMFESFPCG